ncbi:hypothetical protein ACG02S_07870 [Roseateles sp. DC23W]|uniref:Cysteine-rich VLP n=1 Tax=Pelomonas dachongensis TaxID=3299029 RepID=A0ABW7EK12_9BURK
MTGRAFVSWPDARSLPERPPLTDDDVTERRGAEDMAVLHAEQLLSAAMLDHQRAAAAAPASLPGVCTNCGDACLPRAVYCDDDCRDDHEARVQTLRRQGAGR